MRIYLPRVKLWCNLDALDVKWHGWLMDRLGIPVRKATEKQYQEAMKRRHQ